MEKQKADGAAVRARLLDKGAGAGSYKRGGYRPGAGRKKSGTVKPRRLMRISATACDKVRRHPMTHTTLFGGHMRYVLSFLLLSLSPVSGYAQTKVKVFVSEIEGPDPFICERYKMLFMEELAKIKSVQLVTTKEGAQFMLSGIGRVDQLGASISGVSTSSGGAISGSAGSPNALLSVKLINSSGEILFVGNKSSTGSLSKGATQAAVVSIVKDIKKQLKWK